MYRLKQWIALTLFFSISIPLWSVNPDPIACVQQLETNFFQPYVVNEALSSYQIPQALWVPITQGLITNSLTVPNRMKKVTANMVPNPIEYPLQKEATAVILKEVLFDVFMETMRQYQVNERPTADFIFDYIFSRQKTAWSRCFSQEKNEPAF